MKSEHNMKGYTIVELLIFIMLFSLLSVIIYAIFNSTQKSYKTVSRTVELRQNLRASLDYLSGELMKTGNSGYSMTANMSGVAKTGFTNAGRDTVSFSEDIDMDGVATVTTIALTAASDSDGDGVVDTAAGTASLERTLGALTPNTIMDDIQAVQFAYAYDNDGDGQLDYIDANGNVQQDAGEIVWAYDSDNDSLLDTQMDGTALTENISYKKIRMVRIWILGRTSSEFKNTEDTRTYNLGGVSVAGNNDNYGRCLLSTTVKCRNMGI